MSELVHVRVKGYRLDKRCRLFAAKTNSDGRTLCGADPTVNDHERENATALVKHASFGMKGAIEYVESMCPACKAAVT